MTEEDFLRKLSEEVGLDFEKVSKLGIDHVRRTVADRVGGMRLRRDEAIERELHWGARFKKLVELTEVGPETTQSAMDAAIPEKRMDILRWLDPKSKDFLGSGVGMPEFFLHRQITDYQASFSAQMRDEMRRRLRLISLLGYEYQRISNISIQGVATIESVIEDLICGKFDDIRDRIEWAMEPVFSEKQKESIEIDGGHEEYERKKHELWAPVYSMMYEACEHLTPPRITRAYDSVEEMLGSEGGLVQFQTSYGADVLTTPAAIQAAEKNQSIWPRLDPSWSLQTIESLFRLGVRWHGPHEYEPGYFHMANGELFPDDPERYFGIPLYRHYGDRPLRDWLHRHEEPTN